MAKAAISAALRQVPSAQMYCHWLQLACCYALLLTVGSEHEHSQSVKWYHSRSVHGE